MRGFMPDKKLFEKWQTWVALIAGILTIITLSFIIPNQIASLFKSGEKSAEIIQVLAGEILDEHSNPLPGVEVQLPEFNISDKTDENGRFEFSVTASKESQVAFRAKKKGYETVNLDPYLGDSFFNFKMKKR